MSQPQPIWEIMLSIAADPNDSFGRILRKCPFIQKELMSRGLMSFDDLTDEECDRLIEEDLRMMQDKKRRRNGKQ